MLVSVDHLRELMVNQRITMPSSPEHFAEFAFTPFRQLRRLTLRATLCCQVLGSLLEKCPSLAALPPLVGRGGRQRYDEADQVYEKRYRFGPGKDAPSVSVWTAQSVERQCRQLETLRIIDCDNVVGFVPERTTV